MSKQVVNDLSRSLVVPLEMHTTLIAVVEVSQSGWLVGGIVPGIERQPLKKLGVDQVGPAQAAAAMAGGTREQRPQDYAHHAVAFEVGHDGLCWSAGSRCRVSSRT